MDHVITRHDAFPNSMITKGNDCLKICNKSWPTCTIRLISEDDMRRCTSVDQTCRTYRWAIGQNLHLANVIRKVGPM